MEFQLAPVSPFRLGLTVWALRRRPGNAADRWDGHAYQRVLVVNGEPVEVTVTQSGPAEAEPLTVIASISSQPECAKKTITSTLNRLLGLRRDLGDFYRLAAHDSKLRPLSNRFRGLKPPRFESIFETLVNAIACQQLTLTVGIQLLNRLTQRWGLSLTQGRTRAYAFPRPQDLATHRPDTLRALGFSHQKSLAIIGLARGLVRGQIDLDAQADHPDSALIAMLRRLRGIGAWSAEYTLLRGYGRVNVFPADDVGGRNNLRRWLRRREPFGPEQARRALARWHPYQGLIYFHLLLDGLDRAGHLRV
jgi:DNA-3-methyladenine glycosylase II